MVCAWTHLYLVKKFYMCNVLKYIKDKFNYHDLVTKVLEALVNFSFIIHYLVFKT